MTLIHTCKFPKMDLRSNRTSKIEASCSTKSHGIKAMCCPLLAYISLVTEGYLCHHLLRLHPYNMISPSSTLQTRDGKALPPSAL